MYIFLFKASLPCSLFRSSLLPTRAAELIFYFIHFIIPFQPMLIGSHFPILIDFQRIMRRERKGDLLNKTTFFHNRFMIFFAKIFFFSDLQKVGIPLSSFGMSSTLLQCNQCQINLELVNHNSFLCKKTSED